VPDLKGSVCTVAAVATLVVAAPALGRSHPPEPPVAGIARESEDPAYTDPARELGANSPSCRYALDPKGRRNCRATGSATQAHSLSSYGLDVRVGFSITDPGKSFLGALQTIGAGLWMGVLYAIKGVLLLLEWSFSLDLTNQGMPQANRSLRHLHDSVFGDSWLLFGITVAGLWGMWRGLIQRRASETLGGLAATLALIVVALVIISEPERTVGAAARLANGSGLTVLAAATSGDAAHPRQALTSSLAGVFDSTVKGPWCALEFGSAEFCDERTGDLARPTIAEVWLQYLAQSWQRDHLRRLTKGEDENPSGGLLDSAAGLIGLGAKDRFLPKDVTRLVKKAPERARMQESGGTFPRLALLGMTTIGMAGAIALYAYLGLRLLLSAAMSLLLLLVAPAMLIAPAFGDSGRATFLAWIKRLIGALVAKLLYAIFLAVVLAATGVFTRLDIGWFGTWLLLAAFWWGVFVKRHELIAFVSAGAPRPPDRSVQETLGRGYYAWQVGRAVRQIGGRGLQAPRGAVAAATTTVGERRAARASAVTALATERLDAAAHAAHAETETGARRELSRETALRRELRAVDRKLQGFDEQVATARARDAESPKPSKDQQALLRHRSRVQAALESDEVRRAPDIVRSADRNRAYTGRALSDRDLQHRRAAALASDDPRTRELAQAASGDSAAQRNASRWMDRDELRERSRQERQLLRDERRRRRAEQGVFRRR
jgi:hypothetical protein